MKEVLAMGAVPGEQGEVLESEEEETPEGSEGSEGEEGEGEQGEGEPEGEENEGLSAAEAKEAANLYKLLKDKSQQKNVIRILAQQAGLLGENAPETKREVAAAKKDLKSIIKDKLGPEFGFLTDKLGDMMEAVLEQERQSTVEVLNSVQQQRVENETTQALNRLSRETKGESKQFENKMIELMERIKPSDNLSVYEYLKDLYTLASSNKSATRSANQLADKIRRNAGNAAERLNSRGTGKGGTPQGPEKKGLRAAVEYAIKQQK